MNISEFGCKDRNSMGKVGKEGEEKGNCVEVLEYSGLECGMLGCWEL